MEKVVINSKIVKYTVNDDGEKVLPRLFAKSKTGKEQWWEIRVSDNFIYTSKGFTDSDVITEYKPIEVSGKNIGRKNETSSHNQALLEAQSKWNKKHDAEYKPKKEIKEEESDDDEKDESEDEIEFTKVLPMLANKYTEKTKLGTEGVYVSEKLDGIRALTGKNPNTNEVEMWSRTGKTFPHFNKIKHSVKMILEELESENLILDGELYSHTIPFTEISGIVRRTTNQSKYENKIEYYIFDVVDTTMEYTNRLEILKKIKKMEIPNIHVVLSTLVFTHDEILESHDEFVKQGYEGIIVRKPKSKYEIKHRSSGLLKYKQFEDTEFEVVDVECGKGTEEGCVIFVCKDNNSDKTFNVRPRGSMQKRRWQYEHSENYIGKKLTVRWQKNSNGSDETDELPRFGVGIKFDQKTESLEIVDFRDYE